MKLVIDANILFSILIKKGMTAELIVNSDIELFAPEFIYEEFLKYKLLLELKTHRTKNDFIETFTMLKMSINSVSKEKIMLHMKEAKIISPDNKDDQYFALALKLKCSIWSNDKELKNQKSIKVYATKELIKILL